MKSEYKSNWTTCRISLGGKVMKTIPDPDSQDPNKKIKVEMQEPNQIVWIETDRRARLQGNAEELLKEIVADARKENVSLYVKIDNYERREGVTLIRLLGLFERAGFQRVKITYKGEEVASDNELILPAMAQIQIKDGDGEE